MSFSRRMGILSGIVAAASSTLLAAEGKRPVTFEDINVDPGGLRPRGVARRK